MKRFTAALLTFATLFISINLSLCPVPAHAQAMRTFNSPVRPFRRLAAQFGSNMFTTTNPDPNGAGLTRANSTGKSTGDGSTTISFTNGFTAPITVTVFLWQDDAVTKSNACWVRLAPVASGGTSNYTQVIDSQYALCQFAIPPNTPFLVQTSTAVTGNVYTDAPIDLTNNNSATGF